MNASTTKKQDTIMKYVFWGLGLLTLLILIVIIGYILINGLPHISWEFLTTSPKDFGAEGGILPMIVSTIYVTFFAVLIATPIGVGSAIYLYEYAGEGKFVKAIRFCSESLASLPSIIFGLFGLAFFVEFLNLGWCILSASLTLAIMAMPTIMRTAENALEAVPPNYREGSLGMGATRWQTIENVILPAAIPGIITGVILGMARAIEETAAIMYTVGSSTAIPITIFDPARPLPLHLYMLATEGISIPNTFATATVLIVIILAITISTNYLVDRYQKKMMGE
ncbi:MULTISPECIES: phosphate ABC transporter permease PstA [Methanosphaera]|mgnify:CR=1 FL=1|jgi:phosphate transport system permease protein|uniref:Phosphate transport system permease protein PstA n=2 Tax=Methanosphaera stadtmanae TaxID=2317 RepID=Q2NHV9_METST|nr:MULTISPECIES: phosphate ABC transporter permease PstA [Methanosphaera]ABC56751.1 PstA [Methanosphaera stadtmanae DSM 3091]MDO5822843.1 phosphate ABC transporter permease PstA [Methanosphaera sp.]MEE0489687.1 phosphate ABC transporter permease PstA [Methanosphaera stadtmanae]OEC89623.1 phosphate ABC transporter, permease protein PstA [Methanosphaera sp. A6]RAP03551.1 phosphate ABC transporter, permease protein PstA [Methanosphaera stadtmanae]